MDFHGTYHLETCARGFVGARLGARSLLRRVAPLAAARFHPFTRGFWSESPGFELGSSPPFFFFPPPSSLRPFPGCWVPSLRTPSAVPSLLSRSPALRRLGRAAAEPPGNCRAGRTTPKPRCASWSALSARRLRWEATAGGLSGVRKNKTELLKGPRMRQRRGTSPKSPHQRSAGVR